jgi:hypothetical protein
MSVVIVSIFSVGRQFVVLRCSSLQKALAVEVGYWVPIHELNQV